jgi:hypothetical protein
MTPLQRRKPGRQRNPLQVLLVGMIDTHKRLERIEKRLAIKPTARVPSPAVRRDAAVGGEAA